MVGTGTVVSAVFNVGSSCRVSSGVVTLLNFNRTSPITNKTTQPAARGRGIHHGCTGMHTTHHALVCTLHHAAAGVTAGPGTFFKHPFAFFAVCCLVWNCENWELFEVAHHSPRYKWSEQRTTTNHTDMRARAISAPAPAAARRAQHGSAHGSAAAHHRQGSWALRLSPMSKGQPVVAEAGGGMWHVVVEQAGRLRTHRDEPVLRQPEFCAHRYHPFHQKLSSRRRKTQQNMGPIF